MILEIMNDAEKKRDAINELTLSESKTLEIALLQKNLKKRFELYNQARIIRRIKEELIKWETTTRGY